MPDVVRSFIRDIPDFPKAGIIFKDITTALRNPECLKRMVNYLKQETIDLRPDYVAGIESRGFIFGTALAYALGIGFVPLRKSGKLPSQTERVTYSLEYGTDTLEIHQDAIEKGKRVLIIDDLLATGGTAKAAYELVEKVGGQVVGMGFIIELDFLKGRTHLPQRPKIISMIHYS